MAARAGYLKAPEEPEWNGGSAEDSDMSDSVVSSTASITKVSTPTAHSATNPSHSNGKAEGPAHVEVVVRVGTEGISIPGIYIPNIPVKEPEQPPTDPRSWRVAQNVRRCKLILLCSHPQT